MIDEMHVTKEETTQKDEFKVSGEMLLTRIKELVHEGNVRRIVIKNDAGHVLARVPADGGRGGRDPRTCMGSHRRNCGAGSRPDH